MARTAVGLAGIVLPVSREIANRGRSAIGAGAQCRDGVRLR